MDLVKPLGYLCLVLIRFRRRDLRIGNKTVNMHTNNKMGELNAISTASATTKSVSSSGERGLNQIQRQQQRPTADSKESAAEASPPQTEREYETFIQMN